MDETLYLVYIDRPHLDDMLFLQHLARHMGKAGRAAPHCMLIHGSGEPAERRLEAEGFIPEREGGLLRAGSPREAALVEQGVRDSNRKLVGLLTDAMVHAVGLQGGDRGLLQVRADGRVGVSRVGWVAELAREGAVPVIAAVVRAHHAPERMQEVPPGRVLAALAEALGGAEVEAVFFTGDNRPGVVRGGEVVPELGRVQLPPETVSEPEAVQEAASSGVPVLVTSPAGFLDERGPRGTRINP